MQKPILFAWIFFVGILIIGHTYKPERFNSSKFTANASQAAASKVSIKHISSGIDYRATIPKTNFHKARFGFVKFCQKTLRGAKIWLQYSIKKMSPTKKPARVKHG